MILCEIGLRGISPYSQSAPFQSLKNKGEADDAYDQRVWREHMTCDDPKAENPQVCIPPMAIKKSLEMIAAFKGEKTKGSATWSKHFVSGILCMDFVPLMNGAGKPIRRNDVTGERLYMSSTGDKKGGKRVWRIYPRIEAGWQGTAKLFLIDEKLQQDPAKVNEYMSDAGALIGVGRFRPERGGFYGRFEVTSFTSKKYAK